MKIPITDVVVDEEEKRLVNEVLDSGWFTEGKKVETFENNFAKYVGTKHALGTNNGTGALHLALLSLGIGQGDEVIVPTLTFIASANSILYTGAKPVFADSKIDTMNVDPDDIEKKISDRTKAVMVVHLNGMPCEMDRINEIAGKNNLKVIGDAAQAHGSTYKGKKAGSLGDAAIFSFFANKIMTTGGEGGMITTDNEEIHKMSKILKNHGRLKAGTYIHEEAGYNYKMTELQAAIGIAQLKKLDGFIREKRRIAKRYNENLGGVVSTVAEQPGLKGNCWMYAVLFKDEKEKDRVRDALKTKEIDARDIYYPVHLQPCYKEYNKVSLPVAEEIAKRCLMLPTSPKLTDEQVDYISDEVKKALKG